MIAGKDSVQKELQLFHEGRLFCAYEKLGAHLTIENETPGVRFTVWAPGVSKVAVAGDFNGWWGKTHPLRKITPGGVWSAFFPGLGAGHLYKYEIHTPQGNVLLKADPFGFYSEQRPGTASVIYALDGYDWKDEEWLSKRQPCYQKPVNIYELHLGSWKRKPDGRFMNYRELAHELTAYALEMGYTHLELLPLMEHPFDGSWGYQVTGYYSATSRYGTPHDLMYFINYCHQHGLGVILDWVPSHFCRDEHGLGRFIGTVLYEAGESAEWGTYLFDFAKPEVISFLISNAIFWFDKFHVDGLRLDAVASMLYLDYGKKKGEWQPNSDGGNENYAAVSFLRKLHEVVFQHVNNPLMIAEESTVWPLVTKPTYDGGLGFNFKWNMGWMNDILQYMGNDPFYRGTHHNILTFSLMYAFSENFILPLSHDEVVHGKKSLIEKMPGDYGQKFANLRLLLGYMTAHPGKKLLFMGGELAQFHEWRNYEELDWKILGFEKHRCFRQYVKELNNLYLSEKALWQLDYEDKGFSWVDADNKKQSVVVFLRRTTEPDDFLVVVCNFTSVIYKDYRIGVPRPGWYKEIFNSDLGKYGGSEQKNHVFLRGTKVPWHNQPYSLVMKIPPLSIVLLKLR